MDIPLALEQLTRTGRLTPADDWGPYAQTGANYASFAAGWRGPSLVPTLQELADADALATTVNATGLNTAQRAGAKTLAQSDPSQIGKALRGEASVLVDEINALRDWITQFKAAVAASTTLANLQTRVAALPPMPPRTLAQAKTAVGNAIDAGVAD